MRLHSFSSALAFLLAAAPALADPPLPPAPELPSRFRLEYSLAPGAIGCDNARRFQDILSFYFTGDNPIDPEAKARLIVRIYRDGDSHLGYVEIRSEDGTLLWKTVEKAHECQWIPGAIGLALSRAIKDSKPKPEPLPPPPPPAPAPTIVVVAPAKQKMELGLGAALALGKVPSVAAPEIVADLRMLRDKTFSYGVSVGFVPPLGIDAGFGTQVRTYRFTMGVVPCGHVRWFFGCGLVQFALLHRSIAPDPEPLGEPQTFTRPAAVFGGRLGAVVPLRGRFGMRISAEFVTTLPLARIDVENVVLWRASPIAGAIGAGLVATF